MVPPFAMGAHDISLLVQEMRCEARVVTGAVHVAVSSSHSTEPLLPLAVARTTRRELARSTTAWNDVLELMAPPEGVLHVTIWSEAAGFQSVLVASRDVRLEPLDELDFKAGFVNASACSATAAPRCGCASQPVGGDARSPCCVGGYDRPLPGFSCRRSPTTSQRRTLRDETGLTGRFNLRTRRNAKAPRRAPNASASPASPAYATPCIGFLSTCFSGAAGSSWGRERRSTSQASTTRLQRCSERGRKPLGAAWLSWPWNTLTG
jgi:hypothetical protein